MQTQTEQTCRCSGLRRGWDERRGKHGNLCITICKLARGNLCDTGSSTQCSVTTWWGGAGWGGVRAGREFQEGGDMCIPVADLC